MLEKQTILDRTEVHHRTGTIFVQYVTLLVEDGDLTTAIPVETARTSFEPTDAGGDRILAQDPYVQALATATWTPDAITAAKESSTVV